MDERILSTSGTGVGRCLAIVAGLHRTRAIASTRRRLTVRELLLDELEETLLRMANGGAGMTQSHPANDP